MSIVGKAFWVVLSRAEHHNTVARVRDAGVGGEVSIGGGRLKVDFGWTKERENDLNGLV